MDKISIPPTLLEQLNERSGGGFILFFINGRGCFEVYQRADNPVNFFGLHNAISTWAETVRESNLMTVNAKIDRATSGDEEEA